MRGDVNIWRGNRELFLRKGKANDHVRLLPKSSIISGPPIAGSPHKNPAGSLEMGDGTRDPKLSAGISSW